MIVDPFVIAFCLSSDINRDEGILFIRTMNNDIHFPFVMHPMYDQQLIISMMQLIRHRNTSKLITKADKGVIQWDGNAPDKDEEARKNRAAFDAVIKLLDPKAISFAKSPGTTPFNSRMVLSRSLAREMHVNVMPSSFSISF